MIQHRITLGALAALVLAGCGSGGGGSYEAKSVKQIPPAKLAPGQEASIFPWKVGNQWTYTLDGFRTSATQGQQSDPTIEITYRVVSVDPVPGGEKATLEVTQDGQVQDRQVWMRNDKGLFQVSVGTEGTAFEPMQPALLFPLDTGSTFKWSGKGIVPGGKVGTSKAESKVTGPQEVDTEMGRMSGIAIETSSQWESGNLKGLTNSVSWWAPGTGIVRFKQTAIANQVAITQLLKLKSATLK
ncbi:MAG: hypothetical protein M9921_12740 [Fimbriimonadaceae bacterium]|nr:hypothetical protein [Chthonomonadaceae bacterium]MCO5297715.1 hypothetical protein [Fimbriimonadaceae bacterium]